MKKLFSIPTIAITVAMMLGFGACTDTPTESIPVTGVSLDNTADYIEVGEEVRLSPTVTPYEATNKEVSWSSNNDAVATVSPEGIVTGISEGDAVVTATTLDGGFTATFSVTVAEDIIDVVSVSLNVTSKRLARNEELQLTPTINPENATDQRVTWESENPAIASVSETGLVEGLSGGVTTITVTTLDGEQTAECVVTVNVPLTTLDLSPSEIGPDKDVSIIPGQTVPVRVSFTPDDALNMNFSMRATSGGNNFISYSIDPDDKNVINVTGIAPGTTTLIVDAEARVGGTSPITAYCVIEVTKVVTGISFSPASASLIPNNQLTLTPVIAPADAFNKTVSWSSSNENIATVSQSGVVTVKPTPAGNEVTITATATDGYRDGDGNPIKGTFTVFVKAEDPNFGYVSFRSAQTWTVGNYIWSDYVTVTRCDGTLDTSIEAGDCIQNAFKNGVSGDRYYDLFSVKAIANSASVFCTEGWLAPTEDAYNKTDLALYPRNMSGPGLFPQTGGTEKWVSDWGLEYGGYWNGTALVRQETVNSISSEVAGFWMVTSRRYNKLYKEAGIDSSTINRSMSVASNGSMAFGLRCVRPIE